MPARECVRCLALTAAFIIALAVAQQGVLALSTASAAAAAGRRPVACPTRVTSILDLPNIPACRQLLALMQDTQKGCFSLKPRADPGDPLSTLQEDAPVVAEVQWAQGLARRRTRKGAAPPAVPPSQQCCVAAASFLALRCHCWQGFDAAQVEAAVKEAADCGPSLETDHVVAEVGGTDADHLQAALEAATAMATAAVASPLPEISAALVQDNDTSGKGSSGAPEQLTHGGVSEYGGVRLVVGVLTAAGNVARRDAIRETWGADPRLERVLFFTAKPREEATFSELRREAVARRDVVVLPHVLEHYLNITHQTLDMCRAAALERSFTHLLKVDDDSYVHVEPLMVSVALMPRQAAMLGFIESPGGRPHRDPASQWYASPEEWPTERYPPWAHGAGYVLTADVVREIAAGAALMPQAHQLFKLEDIAMGSWLEFIQQERGIKVTMITDTRFNYAGCADVDLVSHYVLSMTMRCMFARNGKCCGKEASLTFQRRFEQALEVARLAANLRPAEAFAQASNFVEPLAEKVLGLLNAPAVDLTPAQQLLDNSTLGSVSASGSENLLEPSDGGGVAAAEGSSVGELVTAALREAVGGSQHGRALPLDPSEDSLDGT